MTFSIFTFPFSLLAVTIAFPKPGATLPPIEKCYVIGAADGMANVVVNGKPVEVFRTGAWTAMVDVRPGVNTVRADGAVGEFKVERKGGRGAERKSGGEGKKVYEKLAYAADEPKPHPKDKRADEVTVVLDPGHGGKSDNGAVSPHGWHEKDANLLLAEDVKLALEKFGYNVVMTRRNDRAIALYDRPKRAHAENADAFISIHHNAPPADRDAGAIRYECAYSWNDAGHALASAIAKRMGEARKGVLPNNGAQHANFAVTRNPEIPSCLVEADFITHPEGEEAAWNPEERARLAAAIAAGFDDWRNGR